MINFRYFVVLCFIGVSSAKLPSYFTPCSAKDPKLNECGLKRAKELIPIITKGDKIFGFPSFFPFSLESVNIAKGDFNLNLKHITMDGMQNAEVQYVKINPKKNHWEINLSIPRVEILADYITKGHLLLLTVDGNGPMNITAIQSTYTYGFDVAFKTKNGKKYGTLVNDTLSFSIPKAFVYFGNLLNGDPHLGPEINKFLNENWQDVINDLGDPYSASVSAVCKSVMQKFLDAAPYNEILLDS